MKKWMVNLWRGLTWHVEYRRFAAWERRMYKGRPKAVDAAWQGWQAGVRDYDVSGPAHRHEHVEHERFKHWLNDQPHLQGEDNLSGRTWYQPASHYAWLGWLNGKRDIHQRQAAKWQTQ